MDRLELAALAAALEQQVEGPDLGVISADRIREALTTGPDFSAEEQRLLWFSPDVRESYFSVRESLDREIQDQLHVDGFGEGLGLRAASSVSDVQTIEGRGYVLTIFHDQIGDQHEWSLSLQLDEDFRSRLFAKTVVRFYDSGGVTWLKGVPDQIGQIGGLWEVSDETPLDRAAKYQLFVGI